MGARGSSRRSSRCRRSGRPWMCRTAVRSASGALRNQLADAARRPDFNGFRQDVAKSFDVIRILVAMQLDRVERQLARLRGRPASAARCGTRRPSGCRRSASPPRSAAPARRVTARGVFGTRISPAWLAPAATACCASAAEVRPHTLTRPKARARAASAGPLGFHQRRTDQKGVRMAAPAARHRRGSAMPDSAITSRS